MEEIKYKKAEPEPEKVEAEVVNDPKAKERPKKVANAKKAKKSIGKLFKESFVAEEIGDLREYIIKDLIVPMIKDAICDGVVNSLSMILWGEKSDYRRRSYGSRYSDGRSSSGVRRYDYSRGYSYRERDRDRDDDYRYAKAQQWEPLECESKQEALDILEQMADIIETYDCVSIADMYDLGGVSTKPEDNNYGWKNISNARIRETRFHTFIIDMPRPICLR